MYAPAVIQYLLLAFLLSAALVALALGLRRYRQRIARGREAAPGGAGSAFLGREFNAESFLHRALLTSRLWKRPVAGLAHSLLLGGALVAILGHASFALSFVGVDVYAGWFGTVVMRWARELAGLAGELMEHAEAMRQEAARLETLREGGDSAGAGVEGARTGLAASLAR